MIALAISQITGLRAHQPCERGAQFNRIPPQRSRL